MERESDLSKSSTSRATRRTWASTTSSRFVWLLRIDGGVKLEGEVREEGLVGEWKVGLLRRGTAVLIDGAVPDRVMADREVLRGFEGMVGDARVITACLQTGYLRNLHKAREGPGKGGVVESLGAGVFTAR